MKTLKKKILCLMMSTALFLTGAGATGNFASSNLAVGTKQLLQDLMNFTVVICPVTGGLAAAVFLLRKGMADEQDGKMWNKRILIALGSGVGGALVSGIISTLASYY